MKHVIYRHVSIQFILTATFSFGVSVGGWIVHHLLAIQLLNLSVIPMYLGSSLGFILFVLQLVLFSPLLIYISFRKIIDWFNFNITINWLFYVWTEATYLAFTILSLHILPKISQFEYVSTSQPWSLVVQQSILYVLYTVSTYILLTR